MIFNKLRSQRPREIIIHRKVTPKGTDYEFYKFWLRTPPGAILNNEYKNEPLVYVASSSTTFYYRYFPTFGLEHEVRFFLGIDSLPPPVRWQSKRSKRRRDYL